MAADCLVRLGGVADDLPFELALLANPLDVFLLCTNQLEAPAELID